MVRIRIPPGYDYEAQHNGTEDLAINNTWWRRFLTRLALHTTAIFYSRDGLCMPVSKRTIVKSGFRVHLTEGATLKYLAENTSIPVPKVHCSFLHKGKAYIVMERVQGQELSTALKTMSPESLSDIFLQLRSMVHELRALVPPGTGIESCIGGSLYDSRIHRGSTRFGPFKTIAEFHSWLRKDFTHQNLRNRVLDQDTEDLEDMMRRQDGPWPPPVFTHGDLNPFNILVQDGRVVSIVDWEFAGWYPNYWEYTSAWFGNVTRTDWQAMLEHFLDMPDAQVLKMEEVRNKWWGE